MGAYKSTRHSTIGFSPYMLTRGTEKAIPLTYMYPEFATQSFESHEAYVDIINSRQLEIHDLVRRNAHQAQRRQKLKYDQNIRAEAYSVGETVWVFCRYIPQKRTPKLMRAWRSPHKIARVLQVGRVNFLDTGQKLHFERLKPHHSGPTEGATSPINNGDIAVFMDPEPEQSLEEVPDVASQPSYREEEPLSEASRGKQHLPTSQAETLDGHPRLRTRLCAGGTRRYYQQFGSSTDTDKESSNALLSSAQTGTNEEQALTNQREALATQPIEIPLTPLDSTENLFSEDEMIEAPPDERQTRQPVSETRTSLIGTSPPLLTNPSLTDVLSNFPKWPQLDQPITHNQPATIPTGSQNAITSSIDAPGHVSSMTSRHKPGRRPPASSLPGENKQVESCRRGI